MPSVSITVVPAGTVTSLRGPDGHDALAGDQDDAVLDRRALVAVDDLAADEGQGRLVGGRRRRREQARERGQSHRSVVHGPAG